MSMAWEISSEDITEVLEAHDLKFSLEISDLVDDGEVEDAVLDYLDFDNQVIASYCNIEDQLIAMDVITGPKKFPLDIDEDAEDDAVTERFGEDDDDDD